MRLGLICRAPPPPLAGGWGEGFSATGRPPEDRALTRRAGRCFASPGRHSRSFASTFLRDGGQRRPMLSRKQAGEVTEPAARSSQSEVIRRQYFGSYICDWTRALTSLGAGPSASPR
ncbi:hypothetical protein EAS54_12990 [Bradyrhizobium guangzhouense]|nr:hypothetical protein EAS54_12990 [Bradyrhizobium guangzhouense]